MCGNGEGTGPPGHIRFPCNVKPLVKLHQALFENRFLHIRQGRDIKAEEDFQIFRTQYFNILTYDWEQMSRDREERVLLICDEAYLMIDQKVPQSLV